MRGKKNVPYVGVTGFVTRIEIEAAFVVAPRTTTRCLMVGVLMSSKTLAGLTNRWPGRYPRKEKVAGIFNAHPKALNLIHYNTDTPAKLFAELCELTNLGGSQLDGFQLNVTWPAIEQLKDYHESFPQAFVVLQVGHHAMEKTGASPERLAEMVGRYSPMIDAVLIDPSGGKGRPFDGAQAAAYLRAIRDAGHDIGLGVAGGLGAEALQPVKPLLEEFPRLNIDAEGRLRTPMPGDALDIFAVQQYLQEAYALCG